MRTRSHAILQERGARCRNAILEHASLVLGSGLGKIGQAGDPGIVKPGRDQGRSGARGAGHWSAPPSAPANPDDHLRRANNSSG